jgi:hypothetical protein
VHKTKERKVTYAVADEFTDTVPKIPQVMAEEDIDDTGELPIPALQLAREIRTYAKGYLRFYRVRSILSGNRNTRTVTREQALDAWQYLASLTPQELPPTLRQPYRELSALALRLDQENERQLQVSFVSQILEITTSIDQIVDNLLTETEKPSS